LAFDTSYLEPLKSYDIKFVVRKDDTEASDVVIVSVGEPVAPTTQLRSAILAVTYSSLDLLTGRLVETAELRADRDDNDNEREFIQRVVINKSRTR